MEIVGKQKIVNEEVLKTLKQKIGRLPMISADVFEIISLLDRPESNFDKIVETVSPGLATRFLSMANSAYYGREVRSIHYAVQLLGYRRMKDMLISSILLNHFTDRLKNFDFDKFHKQAQFCAAVSTILGEILGYENPEDLFTVATLQNIGKLVIAVYFKDEHEKIIALKKTTDLTTAQAEQRIMGVNHAEIGAMVLERFTLPKAICEAVKYHDLETGDISGNTNRRLKSIAREATRIVDQFALPEETAPRIFRGLLKETIETGKKHCSETLRTGMRSKGYDELFPSLLEQASSIVFRALREHLPERIPRMKDTQLSSPE